MMSSRRLRWGLWTWATLVVAFLMAPIAMVGVLSFNSSRFLQFPPPSWTTDWYKEYVTDPTWIDVTLRSLAVAVMASAMSVAVGTLLSFAIVRGRIRARTSLYLAALAPLIIPQIIFALGIYLLYARLRMLGTIYGVAIAHAVLAVPFVVVPVVAMLQSLDPSLERVAQTLGASPARALRTVTLPIMWPALGAAGIFAFMTSLDEVVVALFISGRTAETLPVHMFNAIQLGLNPTVTAAATGLIVFMAAGLVVASMTSSVVARRRGQRAT